MNFHRLLSALFLCLPIVSPSNLLWFSLLVEVRRQGRDRDREFIVATYNNKNVTLLHSSKKPTFYVFHSYPSHFEKNSRDSFHSRFSRSRKRRSLDEYFSLFSKYPRIRSEQISQSLPTEPSGQAFHASSFIKKMREGKKGKKWENERISRYADIGGIFIVSLFQADAASACARACTSVPATRPFRLRYFSLGKVR